MILEKKVFLGINVSHGASAALMIDGKIEAVFQEERFNKIKNYVGYPKESINKCIEFAIDNKVKISEAAFTTFNNHIFPYKYQFENHFKIDDWFRYYLGFYNVKGRMDYAKKTFNKISKSKIVNHFNLKNVKEKDLLNNFQLFRDLQIKLLKKQSKGIIKKITFLDHHMCHAYYAAYSPKIDSKKFAVLTLDSEGDTINQTLWIYKNKQLKKINETSQCDLARIYRFITIILRMKPLEHEYKVMGLAPYAKDEYSKDLYNKVFKNILKVKNCKVVHKNRPKNLFSYLYKKTSSYRFDNIAGAVQILIEQISSELLRQINKKYKINTFSISGGVSMNIKMNRNISNLKFVKKLFVSPTGTDESLCIGACYYLNRDFKQNYLSNIYLGQNISDKKIDKRLIQSYLRGANVKIKENVSHLQIANLLKNNEIIAVARGREEFGARALGNRSILLTQNPMELSKRLMSKLK